MANNDVTVLQVPYYWLIQRSTLTWINLKNFWDKVIPNNEILFQKILEERKWNEYKRSIARKGTPQNYFFNIPYSIRLRDVDACAFQDNFEYV